MKKALLEIIILSLISFAIIFAFQNHEGKEYGRPHSVEKITNSDIQKDVFGIATDSFQVEKFKVRKNETFSTVLLKYGVPYSNIDYLYRHFDSLFDFRKFKQGQNYYIYKNEGDSVKYMVYENNQTDYTIFSLSPPLEVIRGNHPVEIRRRTAKGSIRSSLWNAMTDNNISPILAIELSDIYAWTIDFFGISKGDQFKVIYDEKYVNGEFAGIGKIYASWFYHLNESYYAFRFTQDGKEDFFDEEGNSLRKAFLKAPLSYNRISSRYSNSRFHPVLKYYRPHRGVDYAAPAGTPVYSIGDGIVVRKAYSKSAGRYVQIKHNSVYKSGYNHFSRFAKGIYVGKKVKQGTLIGYVGSTGLATGPHLDFRIWKNGQPVNPLHVKAPPVEPVKNSMLTYYSKVFENYIDQLKAIELAEQ